MNFSPDPLLPRTDGGKYLILYTWTKPKAYYSRGTEPDKCWIKAVAVDENYQDKGIATALLRVFGRKDESRIGQKDRLGAICQELRILRNR